MASFVKNFALLIFINLLWGFIPIPAIGLFSRYSLFTILLMRFLCAGILMFLVAFMLALKANKKNPKLKQEYKIGFRKYLEYIKSPNSKFFKKSQFLYLALLSMFGMTFQIIFFFLALNPIGILLIAIFASVSGEEDVTPFKILYIALLMVVIWIFFFVYSEQAKAMGADAAYSFFEFLYAPLFGIFLAIFYAGSEKDRYSEAELKMIRHNSNYKLIRMIFKVATIMVLTSIFTIPVVWILSFMPTSESIHAMVLQFFDDFSRYASLFSDLDFIIISFGATFVPYVIYFYLEGTWESSNLAFENWVSILGLLEPVFSLIFGVWLLKEQFMPFGFVMIIILTIAAIIMRYIDETENKIIAILLIKHKKVHIGDFFKSLYELRDCQSVHTALGPYDFIMEIKLSSQKRFYKLIKQKIPTIFGPALEDLQVLFIEKTIFDRNIEK
jgi:drug/metabolite transporter (DMT)-like permease